MSRDVLPENISRWGYGMAIQDRSVEGPDIQPGMSSDVELDFKDLKLSPGKDYWVQIRRLSGRRTGRQLILL